MTMIGLLMVATALGLNCTPADPTAVAQLYTVTAGQRLSFYASPDCTDAACREKAYVVPGDRVIVYDQAAGRRCALYPGPRQTTGWLDSDRLRPHDRAAHPPITAWSGRWVDGDDTIRLRLAADGRLRIDGDAYWPGAHPTKGWPSGWPHTGAIHSLAMPDGDRVAFSDGPEGDACHAVLRLLGDYLLVNDDSNCGGMNFRFQGVYTRRRARGIRS